MMQSVTKSWTTLVREAPWSEVGDSQKHTEHFKNVQRDMCVKKKGGGEL